MPDTTETLTMLREAHALGLLPAGWKFSEVAPDAVLSDDELGAIAMRYDDGWMIKGYSLSPLLDHLAGLGLRCIFQPACQAQAIRDSPWWQVVPARVGRVLVEGGVPCFDALDYPGILGLLAAAVAAERWRRKQEGVPDA